MQVIETSIPAVLRERASLQPNDTAFTFIEYDRDRAESSWRSGHQAAVVEAELAGAPMYMSGSMGVSRWPIRRWLSFGSCIWQ
jgi:hypothetical protein